ncbi:TadE family protein [Planctomicrobium sp. SH661]|uniref:TadE family protein n=1 Tax=Planctomicrobium sp. SH661 TaxID=3448124 RepID=UPI003F5C39B1
MFRKLPIRNQQCRDQRRSGTATVELAVVLPVFMTILLGIAEMSRGLDVSERLSSAVRQGGRQAASDMSQFVPNGTTPNQKVIKDIQNMLTASGLDGSKVTVTITHADGNKQGSTFNLADSANYLKYFKVTATVDYSDVGLFPRVMKNRKLVSSVVFRLGRSTLSG